MSGIAILIVLTAALAHASWNIVAHGVSRIGMPFLWWGAVSSTVVWAAVIPFTGGLGADLGSFALGVGVSGVLHVGYMLVLQRGYAVGSLSTVYAAARGSGPIISIVLAITLLGERPGWLQLAGVAVVMAGILVMVALERRARTAPVPGARRRRIDPGIAFGLLTGVAIAVYTIWDAHAVRTWHLAPVAFMVGTTLIEIPMYSAALGRRHRELLPVLRRHWPRVLVFGVLSPLAYILVLVAVTIAPVALVAPMREISVVLVGLFGALVLREGRVVWRIGASVLVLAGIVLLAI